MWPKKVVQEFTKITYFENSMSFKVIDVGIIGTLVSSTVMISSESLPICNRFHAKRVNSGKMTIY